MTIRKIAETSVLLLALYTASSPAQDLTVHVVGEISQQPLPHVLVRLHYGCDHSMRPIEVKQETDASGTAIFHSLSLKPLEFCVFPDYAYASKERYFFMSPEEARELASYKVIGLTSLPADVIFHVRRLTLAERIRNLFRYD